MAVYFHMEPSVRLYIFATADPDNYECPVCGKRFNDTFSTCPSCGNIIAGQSKRSQDDWVEEAEELDWMLGDD